MLCSWPPPPPSDEIQPAALHRKEPTGTGCCTTLPGSAAAPHVNNYVYPFTHGHSYWHQGVQAVVLL